MIDFKQRHIDNLRQKVAKELEVMEDGYKVWWPLHGSGYLNSFDLRVIADYLDELNKDWDTQIDETLGLNS